MQTSSIQGCSLTWASGRMVLMCYHCKYIQIQASQVDLRTAI